MKSNRFKCAGCLETKKILMVQPGCSVHCCQKCLRRHIDAQLATARVPTCPCRHCGDLTITQLGYVFRGQELQRVRDSVQEIKTFPKATLDEVFGDRDVPPTVNACAGCKRVLERDDGCNHMTCTSCEVVTCLVCGDRYDSKAQRADDREKYQHAAHVLALYIYQEPLYAMPFHVDARASIFMQCAEALDHGHSEGCCWQSAVLRVKAAELENTDLAESLLKLYSDRFPHKCWFPFMLSRKHELTNLDWQMRAIACDDCNGVIEMVVRSDLAITSLNSYFGKVFFDKAEVTGDQWWHLVEDFKEINRKNPLDHPGKKLDVARLIIALICVMDPDKLYLEGLGPRMLKEYGAMVRIWGFAGADSDRYTDLVDFFIRHLDCITKAHEGTVALIQQRAKDKVSPTMIGPFCLNVGEDFVSLLEAPMFRPCTEEHFCQLLMQSKRETEMGAACGDGGCGHRRVCAACGRQGAKLKICSPCKAARNPNAPRYCNVDCQTKHWGEHKPHCSK